jgi:branched-chain amino acid transport system substrate-binding protein
MNVMKEKDMAENVPIWMHAATDYSILKPLGENAPEDVMGTVSYHHYFPDIQSNKDFVFAYLGEYESLPGFPAYNGYITAWFIAEAFRKAGAVDKEKFVHALEGLKIESPNGPIEMRACDHQAVLPMYLGVTKKSKKQDSDPFVSSKIVTIEGKELMRTCEKITAVRMQ